LRDSPLSRDEPAAFSDITSADSFLAASSKLDEVRVEDSKKRFSTSLPCRVGSFSSTPAKAPAVSRIRSTSSRVRSAIEIRCLLELDLDPLAARGREVLPDVVGADRQLTVAAVNEDGELDAGRPAVLEERFDRGTDRAAGVEDIVDEHAGRAAQVEVESGRVDDGLLLPSDCVVPVEGDVDRPECDLLPAAFLDQGREPLRQRYAARVDADEREPAEIVVALDHLVRDPRQGAGERLGVQQSLGRYAVGDVRTHSAPFRPRRTGLKGRAGV
jgi:hypothetical protein